MKWRYVGLFGGLWLMLQVAAQASLDPDFAPLIPETLMSREVWEKNSEKQIDYVSHKVAIQDADVNLANDAALPTGCSGFTTIAPTYRIEWVRETLEEIQPLRLFFVGDQPADTLLVVQEPDTDWLCVDNWSNTQHPLLDLAELRSGAYNIWVASSTPADFSGLLVATVGTYTPDQPPLQPVEFKSIFQGSGGGDARLTYLEMQPNSTTNTLDISVDVILKGKRGDYFRVWVYLYDAATDTPIRASAAALPQDAEGWLAAMDETRLRSREERYDYGINNNGAFEFSLPLDTLPVNITLYPLVRVEMSTTGTDWQEVFSYAAEDISFTVPQ